MRHCPECKAIVNPKWDGCIACGYKLADRLIDCHVKSAVLGRTVKMILDPNTPGQVVFDGAKYAKAETDKLKTLDRESLLSAHIIKREFEGTVQ
ncbi:MAG: hypothetical protein JRD04_11680 [Deltaproteobacteria bacterium]|nr:hypothetical protein [Deltaproteobacteria bacterium]